MLFLLDDGLLECLDDAADADLVRNAVEFLSLAHREGKHILTGSREILEDILAKCSLRQRDAAMLERIRNERSQYGHFHLSVNRYVRVVRRAATHIQENGSQRIIYISLDKLQDSSTVQKTILLAENLLDTDLYLLFAKVYMSHARMKTLQVVAEQRGGGGSQVVTEYERIRNSQSRLCLCLVDSDKRAPESSIGDIGRKISAMNSGSSPMCEAVITKVRMIENHFSIRQLEIPSIGNSDRMKAISFLEKMEQHSLLELRQSINFKDGVDLSKIHALPPDAPERSFFKQELKKLASSRAIAESPCLTEDECHGDPTCECGIMPGFGDAILENTLRELSRMSIPKLKESLCPATRNEWLDIGGIVFAWCCARTRVAV